MHVLVGLVRLMRQMEMEQTSTGYKKMDGYSSCGKDTAV